MHHEEGKRPPCNEKLSLDQFARKVSNKNNLLYTLAVKGKDEFSRQLLFVFRPNLPAGAALLLDGVHPRPAQRPQALL